MIQRQGAGTLGDCDASETLPTQCSARTWRTRAYPLVTVRGVTGYTFTACALLFRRPFIVEPVAACNEAAQRKCLARYSHFFFT